MLNEITSWSYFVGVSVIYWMTDFLLNRLYLLPLVLTINNTAGPYSCLSARNKPVLNSNMMCRMFWIYNSRKKFSSTLLFLSDELPKLETLDFIIRIGSIHQPSFLHFDLYLYSAYAAHYVYFMQECRTDSKSYLHGLHHVLLGKRESCWF